MDSVQRTIPRSAQKAAEHPPRSVSPSQTRYRPRASNSITPPTFDTLGILQAQGGPNLTPDLEAETASPDKEIDIQSERERRMLRSVDATSRAGALTSFCSAVQSAIRWVGHPGRDAIAVAGSSNGHVDHLSVFAVRTDLSGSLTNELKRTIVHNGQVAALASSGSDGLLVSASTRGVVSVLDDVEHGELKTISPLLNDSFSPEGTVGLCLVDSQVCVAGERGYLYLLPLDAQAGSSQPPIVEKTVDISVRAVATVDIATPLVAVAGAKGVTIWDLRDHKAHTRFASGRQQYMSAVTTDISQPHFILGGSMDGVVYTWDRRMVGAADSRPLTYAHIQYEPVWDISVVSAGRPGRVLTCSEEGRVCLLDFGAAYSRTIKNGWYNSDNIWCSNIEDIDVSRIFGESGYDVCVNSVDAHFSAELCAFSNDAGMIGFGKLSEI